jgi:glycosyltransferase involved in cell wall biosynthesis
MAIPDPAAGFPARRIALAHHWLMSMRGGEKTLSAIADLFPGAPVYCLLANRDQLDERLAGREIRCSWLQRLNRIPDLQRKALPLLARAARSLDARDYDAVICSDAAIIKAIRTRPDALKLCYCHSPMRYVWDLYDEYRRRSGPLAGWGLRLFAGPVRRADRRAAETVDVFVANSRHVADRIRRHYGRDSVVIPPPVDVRFPPAEPASGEFYLALGELVSYKRAELAVEACTRLNRPLVVIGTGPLLGEIRRMAGPSVRVLGWQPDEVVRDHLRRCRALLFCGEEDFGLTPVEAMAAGRPVIAFRAGGATETVLDGRTGRFFDEPTADALSQAILQFEADGSLLSPRQIQAHAAGFSEEVFRRRFEAFCRWCLARFDAGGRDHVRRAAAALPPDAFG